MGDVVDPQSLLLQPAAVGNEKLLDDWKWLLQRPHKVVAVTKMGDAFLQNESGELLFLDTLEGLLHPAAPDLKSFYVGLQDGTINLDWLAADMVWLMERRGLTLQPAQCFGYKIPPILGGPLESTNVEPINAVVYFSIMGQIHRQVKDLPPGTKIDGDYRGRENPVRQRPLRLAGVTSIRSNKHEIGNRRCHRRDRGADRRLWFDKLRVRLELIAGGQFEHRQRVLGAPATRG